MPKPDQTHADRLARLTDRFYEWFLTWNIQKPGTAAEILRDVVVEEGWIHLDEIKTGISAYEIDDKAGIPIEMPPHQKASE